MNQQQLLQAIHEKTGHIRGGIASEDMDIVINALDERDKLIADYADAGFGQMSSECQKIAADIRKMEAENNAGLKARMAEANEKVFEARRKIKELQTGKKATTQYYGGAKRGGAFDLKK